MANRNPSVDIAKFVAAIFVIGIHTRPLSDISEIADFFLCDIIFRTAVPFFAVCTGYYISKKIRSNGYEPIVRMALRVLLLYVGWSLFYLLILSFSWKASGYLSFNSYVGWFKSFLLGSSYFHLWYLAQLFWALFPFYLILKYLNPRWQTIITCLLWLVGVFAYVYSDVLGIGQGFVSVYGRFGAISEMIGRMLPLLLAGSILARRPIRNKNTAVFISLLFLGCLSIEVFILKDKGASRFSYVLFTLPLAFFLFNSIKQFVINPHIDTRMISKASMNIYFLHPAIVFLLTSQGVKSPSILFISVTVLTISLCIVQQLLLKRKRKVSC